MKFISQKIKGHSKPKAKISLDATPEKPSSHTRDYVYIDVENSLEVSSQFEPKLPPIPAPTPELLESLRLLNKLAYAKNRKPRKSKTISCSRRINGFLGFKAYYARDLGPVSQTVISVLLGAVWAKYPDKIVWDGYAEQYRRYPRTVCFYDWLKFMTENCLNFQSDHNVENLLSTPELSDSPCSLTSTDAWPVETELSPYPELELTNYPGPFFQFDWSIFSHDTITDNSSSREEDTKDDEQRQLIQRLQSSYIIYPSISPFICDTTETNFT